MTNSEMFLSAHVQARIESKRFQIPYSQAFGNALRGFYMVRRGYRGVEIIEPRRVWA